MSDILDNINNVIGEARTTTPAQMMRKIEKMMNMIDDMEDFVNKNVEKGHRMAIKKYTQSMRTSAVNVADIYQEFIDKAIEDM